MGLGETGDWQGAVERIVATVGGGADPLEGSLPEGYGTGTLLEQMARQLEADKGIELGMSLPSLVAAFSGATQGGFLVPLPYVDPETKQVNRGDSAPVVVQFMGIAEAGQQKSTLLKEIVEPLKTALDREAAGHRRTIVDKWRQAAMDAWAKGSESGNKLDETGAWEKVYNGGLCTSSTTDQGTPEGIRNNIVRHGGHRVILTAEPDVLMEVSQYANKGTGGSIGLFLRGWGQEDLAVDRAGTDALYAREISLPYVILLQPDSFVAHTGAGAKGDDFVDRGFFSRCWLWRAERAQVAEEDDDWDFADLDLDAVALSKMVATPFLALREQFQASMVRVAERSDEYRVSKGLEQAWRESKVLWMPRPKEVHRELLELEGGDGLKAVLRVQKMRKLIMAAVRDRDAGEAGTAKLIDPLAVRFTDHVMRWAAVLTLAGDPDAKAVDTDHIEDCATRLMPWLWAGWMRVMRERLEHTAQTSFEDDLMKNPQQHDLRPRRQLMRSLNKLMLSNGPAAGAGFTASQIFEGPRSAMRKQGSGSGAVTTLLNKELAALVELGLVEVVSTGQANAAGKVFGRYRMTAAGFDHVTSEAPS